MHEMHSGRAVKQIEIGDHGRRCDCLGAIIGSRERIGIRDRYGGLRGPIHFGYER